MALPNAQKSTPTAEEQPQGVDYFQRAHILSRFQSKISIKVRRKLFDLAMSCLANKNLNLNTVIDVGTTPDTSLIDSNCMLRWFHQKGFKISLWSQENIQNLKPQFPYCEIIPNSDFLKNQSLTGRYFDLVCASAVIEHTGSFQNVKEFLIDCSRLGNAIMITTPNRFHWLEFHSKIPFLHWLPRSWHRHLLDWLGLKFWAQEENLNLLSESDLTNLAQAALENDFEIEVKYVRSLGMKSNFLLMAYRRSKKL